MKSFLCRNVRQLIYLVIISLLFFSIISFTSYNKLELDLPLEFLSQKDTIVDLRQKKIIENMINKNTLLYHEKFNQNLIVIFGWAVGILGIALPVYFFVDNTAREKRIEESFKERANNVISFVEDKLKSEIDILQIELKKEILEDRAIKETISDVEFKGTKGLINLIFHLRVVLHIKFDNNIIVLDLLFMAWKIINPYLKDDSTENFSYRIMMDINDMKSEILLNYYETNNKQFNNEEVSAIILERKDYLKQRYPSLYQPIVDKFSSVGFSVLN